MQVRTQLLKREFCDIHLYLRRMHPLKRFFSSLASKLQQEGGWSTHIRSLSNCSLSRLSSSLVHSPSDLVWCDLSIKMQLKHVNMPSGQEDECFRRPGPHRHCFPCLSLQSICPPPFKLQHQHCYSCPVKCPMITSTFWAFCFYCSKITY